RCRGPERARMRADDRATVSTQTAQAALRQICVGLRCMLSAIYMFDAENSRIRHVKVSDPAAELVLRNKEYADAIVDFLRLMPVTTQPIDEPLLSTQLPSHGGLFDSRYFREISLPQGHHDSIHTVLARNGRRFGLFSATRHKSVGFFTGDDFAIMRLFAPHIRRAVTISDLMELRALGTEALSATLDRLALGVVVVAGENRILHANEAARDMLANGSRIVSRRGRLTARDSAAETELSRAIALAAADEAALGGTG